MSWFEEALESFRIFHVDLVGNQNDKVFYLVGNQNDQWRYEDRL